MTRVRIPDSPSVGFTDEDARKSIWGASIYSFMRGHKGSSRSPTRQSQFLVPFPAWILPGTSCICSLTRILNPQKAPVLGLFKHRLGQKDSEPPNCTASHLRASASKLNSQSYFIWHDKKTPNKDNLCIFFHDALPLLPTATTPRTRVPKPALPIANACRHSEWEKLWWRGSRKNRQKP
jgi:hypothetical protein